MSEEFYDGYKEQKRALRRISAEQKRGVRVGAAELAIIMETEFLVTAETRKRVEAELDAEERK